MTKCQIENLIRLIPAKNQYIGGDQRSDKKPNRAELCARCINDPAFAWKFVKTFHEAGRRLPKHLPPFFYRVYDHLAGSTEDGSLERAVALTYPGLENTRWLLEAMLLCAKDEMSEVAAAHEGFRSPLPGPSAATGDPKTVRSPLDFEDIAAYIGLEVEVIRDFHDLFFNVRNRFNDKMYIASLVYPFSKLHLLSSDQQHAPPWQQLRIAAYEKGVQELLGVAGIRRESDNDTPRDHKIHDLEDAITAKALLHLQYGDPHSAIIGIAMKMLQAKQIKEHVSNDSRAGLTAVSMSYEMSEIIRSMQAPDIKRRLAAQNAANAAREPSKLEIKASDASVVHVDYGEGAGDSGNPL